MDDQWKGSVEMRLTQLETRVAVAENNIDTINKKLDKIESNTTWLLRIVIGAIILAILGLVVIQKAPIQTATMILKWF
jgi:uncharacterized membrane protein